MSGCESGAFTGRDSMLYYFIGCPGSKPLDSNYKRLGMMRGKTMSASWDTADATGDMSPEFTKENLVTYKDVSFSGDGVSRKEAVYNQSEVKRHVYNPGPETSGQPYVWLKFVTPLDITEGCFMFTKWEDQAPHDDVATWSTEASSAGPVEVRSITETITISTQPTATVSLADGDDLSLSVTASASDSSTLSYQWKKDGTSIGGATSATFSKVDVTTADAGTYTVTISSPTAGTVTSNNSVVTVSAPV